MSVKLKRATIEKKLKKLKSSIELANVGKHSVLELLTRIA